MIRRRQVGEHRDSSRIFNGIGETTAFGKDSKPVLVILVHILRIDGEDSVVRCVMSYPIERPQPVICRRGAGPLNVRSGWKELALGEEHRGGERHEKYNPTPDVRFQQVFADEAAGK